MKHIKKKVVAVAAAALLIGGTTAGTLAYFSADGIATNVITTGSVKIAIDEKMLQEDGSFVPFPEEGISGVMPGQTVSKIVTVENTGSGTAWIRVRLESVFYAESGEELPLTLDDGTPVLTYEILDGWTQGDDGYYYCETPVAGGDSTPVLFEEVSIAHLLGNEYQNGRANLTVHAEAVQTANNGETVWDAAGWETIQEGSDAQ